LAVHHLPDLAAVSSRGSVLNRLLGMLDGATAAGRGSRDHLTAAVKSSAAGLVPWRCTADDSRR
jgi:hypothetical protein